MTRRTVAIVIQDGVNARDVAEALDVFSEANALLAASDHYDVTVLAAGHHPVRSINGMCIAAHGSFAEAQTAFGTIILAGPRRAAGDAECAVCPAVTGWLRSFGGYADRYGALGSGTAALERAGLFEAPSTAAPCDRQQSISATVPGEARAQILRMGRLVAGGGADAGGALALCLVAEDYGAELARVCSDRMTGHPCAAASGSPRSLKPPERPIDRVMGHIRANLGDTLTLDRLAAIAGTSKRSLARMFAAELDVTPHEFVENCRLNLASHLLRETTQGLKVVAHRCGFGGAEQMRGVFQRRFGLSPNAYRSQPRAGERAAPQTRSTSREDHGARPA